MINATLQVTLEAIRHNCTCNLSLHVKKRVLHHGGPHILDDFAALTSSRSSNIIPE